MHYIRRALGVLVQQEMMRDSRDRRFRFVVFLPLFVSRSVVLWDRALPPSCFSLGQGRRSLHRDRRRHDSTAQQCTAVRRVCTVCEALVYCWFFRLRPLRPCSFLRKNACMSACPCFRSLIHSPTGQYVGLYVDLLEATKGTVPLQRLMPKTRATRETREEMIWMQRRILR